MTRSEWLECAGEWQPAPVTQREPWWPAWAEVLFVWTVAAVIACVLVGCGFADVRKAGGE